MIVLPLGTGRSGTSKVAGLLHKHFHIHMGDKWARQPDNFNPEGYYEDYAFGEILKNFMADRVKDEDSLKQVYGMLEKEIQDRSSKYVDWGFKANTLYTCLPTVVSLLPEPPIIIRTKRPIHQIIYSWIKTFKQSYRNCMVEILLREHMIDLLSECYPMHVIQFDSTNRKSDEELLRELCYILNGRGYTP